MEDAREGVRLRAAEFPVEKRLLAGFLSAVW